MNRERIEIGWYAVWPFLFYMVLFTTASAILYRLLESALLSASADMTLYYEVWSDLADILIIGISSAAAAIPILKEGRREIMLARRRSSRTWLEKRKDKNTLLRLLPFGTICLCAFLNLLLGKWSSDSSVSLSPYAVPLGAAVYGILTPFIEELLFRGIVWHRLRRGFTPLESAVLSSLLFAAAHGNIPQAVYGFVMGMIFALSYELTLRFEIPFLLHSTCNLCVLAASSAGWGSVLSSPAWLLFFAAGSASAFVYWGKRLRETKFKL